MTKIKICGLKRIEDVDYVNQAMPDYAGFVFAGEKRKISFETARQLKNRLDKRIQAVGVFINEPLENVVKLCKDGIIDLIQLHSDEDEWYIAKLKEQTDKQIIKAVKVVNSTFHIPLSTLPLFDSGYGSGKTFDWNLIKSYKKPFFLAGGLNRDNLKQAIEELQPYCVDLSTGVETNGVKDLAKILEVVKIAREE